MEKIGTQIFSVGINETGFRSEIWNAGNRERKHRKTTILFYTVGIRNSKAKSRSAGREGISGDHAPISGACQATVLNASIIR